MIDLYVQNYLQHPLLPNHIWNGYDISDVQVRKQKSFEMVLCSQLAKTEIFQTLNGLLVVMYVSPTFFVLNFFMHCHCFQDTASAVSQVRLRT